MYTDKYEKRYDRVKYLAGLDPEQKYEAFNEMIAASHHIVFFGGAGVSTESGIPDFRSKDGLYNQHDVQFDRYTPEYLLSSDCLYNHPEVFYEFYRQKMNVKGIEPNTAHLKLAEMERKGKLDCVITQNIDGLHQKAGSRKVYEVHGSTLRNYCDRCHKAYPSDYIFNSQEPVPKCTVPGCGGMVRPDVTLYGEMLPEEAWRNAERVCREADMMIVGGTSLSVYPAASLLDYFSGKYLVLINRDRTNRDNGADLVFHESIGEVLGHVRV
ncbi:MAG: NAD-dependent protein deacylase [Eubacterium sp.]|nr:NAD-dependent protein deacylase [Eubacterium sp.]